MRSDAPVVATLSVTVLATALGACGEGGENEGANAAGPVITIATDWNSYPTAQMRGLLSEKRGCLLVGGEVVFWPRGTTWDAEANAVIQTDGTRLTVGDLLIGGGGGYEPDTDFSDLLGSSEAAERVTSCVEKTAAQVVSVFTPSDQGPS